MAISVRLDATTEAWLKRYSRQKGLTLSEVIREAVQALALDEEQAMARRPYEALAPFIGRVKGGPPDLSVRTGERFRELLEAKARGRRPR